MVTFHSGWIVGDTHSVHCRMRLLPSNLYCPAIHLVQKPLCYFATITSWWPNNACMAWFSTHWEEISSLLFSHPLSDSSSYLGTPPMHTNGQHDCNVYLIVLRIGELLEEDRRFRNPCSDIHLLRAPKKITKSNHSKVWSGNPSCLDCMKRISDDSFLTPSIHYGTAVNRLDNV